VSNEEVDAPHALVATCVWRCTPEVITALDHAFGDPVDAYVNGSQVWIDDEGPGGVAIEWRLHPVANYVKPRGIATADVFQTLVRATTSNDDAESLPLPASLWDGLEAFAAYDDPVDATVLREWATTRLGIAPTASGQVDHEVVADAWERSERATSIVSDLLAQLGAVELLPPHGERPV
jgi:hypothetical protein